MDFKKLSKINDLNRVKANKRVKDSVRIKSFNNADDFYSAVDTFLQGAWDDPQAGYYGKFLLKGKTHTLFLELNVVDDESSDGSENIHVLTIDMGLDGKTQYSSDRDVCIEDDPKPDCSELVETWVLQDNATDKELSDLGLTEWVKDSKNKTQNNKIMDFKKLSKINDSLAKRSKVSKKRVKDSIVSSESEYNNLIADWDHSGDNYVEFQMNGYYVVVESDELEGMNEVTVLVDGDEVYQDNDVCPVSAPTYDQILDLVQQYDQEHGIGDSKKHKKLHRKRVKDSKKLTRKDRKHFKVSDSVDANALISAWNECWNEEKPEALVELCKKNGVSDIEYVPELPAIYIDDDEYDENDLRYFLIALLPSAEGEFDAISTDDFDNYRDGYRQTVYRADEDCTVADCPSTDPTECPVFKGNVTDVCQKAGIESVFVPKGGYCFIDAELFDTNVESSKEAMIDYLKERFPER